jgi:hypothetical protein
MTEESRPISSPEALAYELGAANRQGGSYKVGHRAPGAGAVAENLRDIEDKRKIRVQSYGAVGDGLADDTAAFRSAIREAEGLGTPVRVPAGTYRLTSGLTVDCSRTALIGEGAVLDFSGMTSGSAITLVSSAASAYDQCHTVLSDIRLIGPGPASTVDGITYDDAGVEGASHTQLRDVNVQHFRTGLYFLDKVHNINHYNCEVHGCATGVWSTSGANDAGERIAFFGGVIFNNTLGVKQANGSGALHFIGTSIDYNGKQVEITDGMVFCVGCHHEFKPKDMSATPYTVLGTGQAHFSMIGGWFITATSGDGTAPDYFFDTNRTTAGVELVNVHMQVQGEPTIALQTGVGRFVMRGCTTHPNIGVSWPSDSLTAGAKNNRLMDGGFEGAAIIDLMQITADTAAITSRLTGTNIQLALDATAGVPYAGAKCLKVTKTNDAGAASFVILAPISYKGKPLFRFYYRKIGLQTGTMLIETRWAAVSNMGDPLILTTGGLGEATITWPTPAAAVAWTKWENTGQINVPASATRMAIRISLLGTTAGDIHFDAFDFQEC